MLLVYRSLSILLLVFFLTITSYAQTAPSYWNDIQENQISVTGDRVIIPAEYRTLSLDVPALRNLLVSAPMEIIGKNIKGINIALPLPDGSYEIFEVVESPVMESGLAVRYPEIKTYAGVSIKSSLNNVRLDLTPQGFHAMILSPDGRVFIDPYSKGDTENYISYYTRNYTREEGFECEVLYDEQTMRELEQLHQNDIDIPTGPQLRTYRVAIAATGEYTIYHGGTVALGLAAVVTALNRVTGVYQVEMAIKMVLIANNDLIIYTNPSTDPYTNSNGSAMLTQNQTTLDAVIGTANYDIGHVFSTGGGGVAYLSCVCNPSTKARGVTGLPSPIGDPFYIDYVAHEMGHQYGGNHSFNSEAGACGGGNRSAGSAYEPGSGSTIMAYAGICAPHNLQNNSDAYFHVRSFDEIVYYTNNGNGNSCPVTTNTGNNPPQITLPAGGFTIPKSTPFALTGAAVDPDGDPLVYCWEEYDLGPAGAPTAPSGNAPIFRSFTSVTSPTRTFPKLSSLLNNTTTIGEILPTYTRNLSFRMTARDNRITGGGVDWKQITFAVTADAGPFLVTSPNTNVSWPGLTSQTITWDVANTTASPVNCANVNILLSVDGGNTYQYTLAANTPNDGSEQITLPDHQTSLARIKVAAAGNIFFDISNQNFTIDEAVPVELITFVADVIDGGVALNWITASELNNSGFYIERSRDNENFTSLSYLEGKGTTTEFTKYYYNDYSVESGVYFYRIKQVDFDGSFNYLNSIRVDVGLPRAFFLSQNHPNPFNPSTSITFSSPVDAKVRIELFNTLGERIDLIVDQDYKAGIHDVTYNAQNLSSGIYYYTMTAAGFDGKNFVATKKMIMMK